MTAVSGAPDFEASLAFLQNHLPYWLASQNPTSALYQLLNSIATQIDQLAVTFETQYQDQDLQTASVAGLFRNFAFAWGLQNEQLPTVLPQLRAYIAARSTEDGSLVSLINTLTSLVNTVPNTTGGPIEIFPSNGTGLIFPDPVGGTNIIFPVSGTGIPLPATFGGQAAGLVLYEFTVGNGPSPLIGLVFPTTGSGLIFPVFPTTIPSDNVIVADGTIPIGAGPGLTFASNQFVQITPNYVTSQFTVTVQNWLAFDRGAFTRAVNRFQPAHWLNTLIYEITTYH